jgi:hypothetical protein
MQVDVEHGVGGVRGGTDSYAMEERRDDFDRENVEARRRERRVGVDTDRWWSGVRGVGVRLGRRSESGIVMYQAVQTQSEAKFCSERLIRMHDG